MTDNKRETFSGNFGLLMTMVGVAVGLGNVWRFPYMVGKFGGSAFLVMYLLLVVLVGMPAMMAEWTLGKYTRRGTLGAFEKGGLPFGKAVGYFFFIAVMFATSYYSLAVGWVGYHAIHEVLHAFGFEGAASAILPPENGFNITSFILQLIMTGGVIFGCAVIVLKGLRRGIEKASKFIMPVLFFILIILIIRSVTLEGAGKGLEWYITSFRFSDIDGKVMAAALGQAMFSLSLGGTMMVMYGSYMNPKTPIQKNAVFTGIGDTLAGVLAGLVIFPAVFAFGLEPGQGPGLIFSTLPKVFASMPIGWLFGLLFFLGLLGAAYLSNISTFDVMAGGLTDNFNISRKKAVYIVCTIVFFIAIPPMLNLSVFSIWDLVFGSGMQTLGSFFAVITAAWCIKRAEALKTLQTEGRPFPYLLYWWMRLVVPLAILFVGVKWFIENVL
ncbi:MAG: sodium-dependent transporter [bacterium]|nr:sodium-dependent transporter [bacterium]